MNEVLRQEKKFLIGLPDYYYHSGNLAKFMLEDPHNRGDGYPIRSLYFDSLDDRDFQEKLDGLSIRRKIRLRCYGPDSPFALLEVKQKEGAMQKKRSLRLTREEAVRLVRAAELPLYAAALAEETADLRTVDLTRCAVVIGSEGRGVSPAALALCDRTVKIPMSKTCESLNAAVAAAVVLWEGARND